MEQQSLLHVLGTLPSPCQSLLVLFLCSFVTVGESPSGVVQGTFWKFLSSRSWSQLSRAGCNAFLYGSVSI